MSFVNPLALLLLLPAAGLLAWHVLWGGRQVMRLPGRWHRIIEATMRPFMAQRVISQQRLPLTFWFVIWTLLVLALARPVLDFGAPAAYANLAGRVIAIDLGAGVDVGQQRLLAYRILDAAPQIPSALVLATAEAFDVVPLTTDRGQLDRYLQVIDAEVMPVSGWAPGIAIVHAESVLDRAGVIVGQTILLTGGRVPRADPAAPGEWLRAVVVEGDHSSAWQNYAERIGARLVDETDIQTLIDDLDDRIADTIRDSDQSGDLALTPWLVAGAALMWLFWFRRIRSS
jgi:hypothetical protein